ncbi:MAG: lysophospholipid acyltransferase family protein [Pikeienuella sp.]
MQYETEKSASAHVGDRENAEAPKYCSSIHVLCWLRTRLFEFYALIMSLGVGAAVICYEAVGWRRNPPRVRGLLRFWSTWFMRGARVILGLRYNFEGMENIPDRPVIFIGNHQSYWESIMMTVLFPHINIVTKRASMDIPVFGWGLRHAPMIPVDRDQPGRNIRRIIREGAASVRAGRSLLIFPEGGRVEVGATRPYSRGFDILYREAGAEVVPFVTNAGLRWPPGFGVKCPGPITLRFFPPIPAGRDPKVFARSLEEFLNAEKDKLLKESRKAG